MITDAQMCFYSSSIYQQHNHVMLHLYKVDLKLSLSSLAALSRSDDFPLRTGWKRDNKVLEIRVRFTPITEKQASQDGKNVLDVVLLSLKLHVTTDVFTIRCIKAIKTAITISDLNVRGKNSLIILITNKQIKFISLLNKGEMQIDSNMQEKNC